MTYSNSIRRRVLAGATTALVAVPLLLTSPVHASIEEVDDSYFDSALDSLGLSAQDATSQSPGVSAEGDGTRAVVALGDFEVTVTAADDQESATTILSNGARVMSLLEEGQSTALYSIDLPSGAFLRSNGSGFDIIVKAGGTNVTLGQISAPWAVDANGTQLPTSYRLDGDTLTQHVETADAAYPIVADPAVTVGLGADGPGVYWNLTGAQAKTISAASASAVALALAGGCAGANKVPKVGGWLSALCGFVGAPTLASVFADIKKILTNSKYDSGACYQLRIPVGTGLHKTVKANCA